MTRAAIWSVFSSTSTRSTSPISVFGSFRQTGEPSRIERSKLAFVRCSAGTARPLPRLASELAIAIPAFQTRPPSPLSSGGCSTSGAWKKCECS